MAIWHMYSKKNAFNKTVKLKTNDNLIMASGLETWTLMTNI